MYFLGLTVAVSSLRFNSGSFHGDHQSNIYTFFFFFEAIVFVRVGFDFFGLAMGKHSPASLASCPISTGRNPRQVGRLRTHSRSETNISFIYVHFLKRGGGSGKYW